MRKLTRSLAVISSLLIMASCSADDNVATSTNERGTASFDCSMLGTVSQNVTRSGDLFYIPEDLIPSSDDVVLKIEGSYIDPETAEVEQYSYGPLKLSDYRVSQPKMFASDYHAAFHWGDPCEEGEALPYFEGEIDFEVIARGKTTEPVSLTLHNSIVCVEFDDIFSNYYTDAEFTVSTSAGNSFDFSEATLDKIVFVEAGTTLSISGSAKKLRDGSAVTFNSTILSTTEKQTLSRINITADRIGGENLNITVDGNITVLEPIQIELNPQGN